MFAILSVLTAVKDYVEIVHKLVEADSSGFGEQMQSSLGYSDFGAILTYSVLLIKQWVVDFFSLNWVAFAAQSIYAFPVIVPNIASAMISEISVLDGYFHNAFTFLETPISYGNQNFLFYCLEKFSIGLINSLFLFLPTSTAHLICLRRFVMQGLEAGYIAGLGTIAGNVLWIGSLIFGLRFIVIPWLSLDILRYLLGFILLVKYMWDSYSEKRVVLEDLSKKKIFLLNFLLAFTEQTNIYPFLSNLSISSDSTFLESFPANSFSEFVGIHGFYLLGILLGSFSLLQFTCWFLENPAFNLYMWMVSSFKITTGAYYKVLNFVFLYLTMICAISSVSYFALDYTLTNPLGFVHEDRLFDQKGLLETAFLNTKASDRNTRRNRGRHGRRERWKRRVRRYRTFDASLYDQGVYDLFTIEDLNYGFDRFWLRRKMRNHRVHFRFFPGPWMRSFKKQLSRPRLESFMGPRVEFFRILFEQVYHPEFHEFNKNNKNLNTSTNLIDLKKVTLANTTQILALKARMNLPVQSIYADPLVKSQKQGFMKEYSALRKFIRKVNTRVKSSMIMNQSESGKSNVLANTQLSFSSNLGEQKQMKPLYSKKWKYIFSKMSHQTNDSNLRSQENLFRRLYNNVLLRKQNVNSETKTLLGNKLETVGALSTQNFINLNEIASKKLDSLEKLSKKDRQILRYKTFLAENSYSTNLNSNMVDAQKTSKNIETLSELQAKSKNSDPNSLFAKTAVSVQNNRTSNNLMFYNDTLKPLTLFHPVKFYLKKEQAFQRKLKFYGANIYRKFGVENNAPYFRTMMQRFFYYYKPTLRWERTMRTATMRKARRKNSRVVRKQNVSMETKALSLMNQNQVSSSLSLDLDKEKEQKLEKEENLSLKAEPNLAKLQKPTHFYSLVSKRASRYRSQIYKDVLQHWYYSPFNRLLLKFDVDSFIRRQPSSYFLTKDEEQLLHLRRFLLSEHYETLRWYTYMQHYRSMKTKIGGTKSFASRLYSQQFMGTFKKVRHLFALTPSSSDNTVLKFDQPLYNEYLNTQTKSILAESFLHEELLADDDIYISQKNQSDNIPKNVLNKQVNLVNSGVSADDLTNMSKKVLRNYLIEATPLRQEIIKKLLTEKNYWELTSFLFKGQKTRGTRATTNEHELINQEKEYFFNPTLTKSTNTKENSIINFSYSANLTNSEKYQESISMFEFQQNLWIELLKKCQNTLYDQESLKNYLVKNVDKRKKQQDRQEKYLNLRLQRLKNWFLNTKSENQLFSSGKEQKEISLTGLTTGIEKAVKESIFFQKGLHISSVKSNLRNNLVRINWNDLPSASQKQIFTIKNHLKNRLKLKELQIREIEQDLKESLKNTKINNVKTSSTGIKNQDFSIVNSSLVNSVTSETELIQQQPKSIFALLYKTLMPFNLLSKEAIKTIFLKPLNLIKNLKTTEFNQSLESWKKQEIAVTKRKKTRKTLKRLRNTNQRNLASNTDTTLSPQNLLNSRTYDDRNSNNQRSRQKRDTFEQLTNLENERRIKSWNQWSNAETRMSYKQKNLFSSFQDLTAKKFKRKRTRVSRYRRYNRAPIKKRTVAEKLKRQFKQLKRYSRTADVTAESDLTRLDKKVELFKRLTKRDYEPTSEFVTRQTKQRRIRQSKQRFWKQKKQKYAQNKQKLRKRRRYTVSKIRALFKEYKRKESTLKIKQWWWNNFLPSFKATVDAKWQNETDRFIQDKFDNLSDNELLNHFDKATSGKLDIGDKDYKPLATPQAIHMRKNLESQGLLNLNSKQQSLFVNGTDLLEKLEQTNSFNNSAHSVVNEKKTTEELDLIGKITQNTFVPDSVLNINNIQMDKEQKLSSPMQGPLLTNMNSLPFYAGWDETLRKFVITNRFLSIQNQQLNHNNNLLGTTGLALDKSNVAQKMSDSNNLKNKQTEFFSSPLKGMNAATTLYWQVPFTTYDPDQFFALGMDGFSPIAWRRFHFRHSKQTTKPILVQSKTQTRQSLNLENTSSLSYNLQQKMVKAPTFKTGFNESFKNQVRRSQKRYKRVKKHPRPPVWFPSGPLTSQVLPVHYIYVFYKRYRLPRDRYIRRRLRKNAQTEFLTKGTIFTKYTDFTLRKRVKPRRKYHRKRHFYKTDNFILRRRSFRTFDDKVEISRATPPNFITESRSDMKQKRKLSGKQSPENLRLRQLRRRVQRQVIRPVWRYKPRAGGYTWPGDYLRLELVKAPILNSTSLNNSTVTQTKNRKTKKKKRRAIQEWQIQPKKYLLQKHNSQVLRKRLEKSQNSHKIFQRSKELSYLLNNN